MAQCPNFAVLNRGRHLYLAGQPSRWALAHISSVVLGLVSSAKTLAGKNILKWCILCLSSLLMNLNYRSLMCSCHSIVFTHATLPSAGISCRRVSVPPSFTSWCSTEMAKRRIMQTMPHDSRGTLVSDDEYLRKTQTRLSPMEAPNAGAAGRWLQFGDFQWKACQLSSVVSLSHWASTLFVCSMFATMQHITQACQQQLVLVLSSCSMKDTYFWILCVSLWIWLDYICFGPLARN